MGSRGDGGLLEGGDRVDWRLGGFAGGGVRWLCEVVDNGGGWTKPDPRRLLMPMVSLPSTAARGFGEDVGDSNGGMVLSWRRCGLGVGRTVVTE